MSKALTEIAKRPGRLPALVTSLAILVWFALLATVQWLFSLVLDPRAAGQQYVYVIEQVLVNSLPFALGVFLSLWAIAPISHELTLRFVLTRAALAAGCGVILSVLVAIVVALFGSMQHLSLDLRSFLQQLQGLLVNLIPSWLNSLPVVLLACVLLWLWLRDHPRKYAVAGLIDDV